MDKLKEQLAVPIAIFKEHGFWFLCGTILIVSLVSWYISTGELQKQQTQYKSDIDSAVSTLKSVRDTPNHPNDSTNKGMDQIMQQFGEDVYQAWLHLAESQKAVLVWNGSFVDDKFLADVSKLQPIETTVAGDHDESINRDNRTLYRNYIDEELPKLADIILSKWQVDASKLGSGGMPGMGGEAGAGGAGLAGPMGAGGSMGAGGMPGMAGMAGGQMAKDDDPSVVIVWNSANQKEITISHFGMATNNLVPSTLEVLYAQEDLWVFQNLMGIIKATNGDALRRHEAAIKYIDYVRIGRSAGDVAGQVTKLGGNNNAGSGNMAGGTNGMMPGMGGAAAGAGGPGMGGGGPGGGGPGGGAGGAAGMMGMGMGGAAGAPAGPAGAPAGGGAAGQGAAGTAPSPASTAGSDRYVDLSYASIKDISRLRNAMKGSVTKPEDMLLAVAKRMPVRMQFKMDQRKLTTLLAECGNSKLPVEVRQVRVNRGTATAIGGGMMGGGMGASPGGAGGGIMPGMPSGAGAGMGSPAGGEGGAAGAFSGGAGGMMGMGGMGGGARPASSIASSKEDPNEIQVEVYGIVYIYNPPDRTLLGLPGAATPAPPAVPVAPVTPTSTTPEKKAPPLNAGAATGR